MSKSSARNLKTASALAGIVFAMLAMAYAAVPLYDLFCRVTGYGGTTQQAESAADHMLDRTITVRFDANVNGLPWEFRPVRREVEVRLGETALANYVAANSSGRPTAGTATFNVSPHTAGAYFNKIECFCFTRQELAPGAQVEMPVQFFIDPDLADDRELAAVRTITLSYTFFPDSDDASEDAGNLSQVTGENM